MKLNRYRVWYKSNRLMTVVYSIEWNIYGDVLVNGVHLDESMIDVMEGSGKKDNFDNEVFEDDILLDSDGNITIVLKKNGEWKCKILKRKTPLVDTSLFDRTTKFVAIGNSYENPGLIEKPLYTVETYYQCGGE